MKLSSPDGGGDIGWIAERVHSTSPFDGLWLREVSLLSRDCGGSRDYFDYAVKTVDQMRT